MAENPPWRPGTSANWKPVRVVQRSTSQRVRCKAAQRSASDGAAARGHTPPSRRAPPRARAAARGSVNGTAHTPPQDAPRHTTMALTTAHVTACATAHTTAYTNAHATARTRQHATAYTTAYTTAVPLCWVVGFSTEGGGGVNRATQNWGRGGGSQLTGPLISFL